MAMHQPRSIATVRCIWLRPAHHVEQHLDRHVLHACRAVVASDNMQFIYKPVAGPVHKHAANVNRGKARLWEALQHGQHLVLHAHHPVQHVAPTYVAHGGRLVAMEQPVHACSGQAPGPQRLPSLDDCLEEGRQGLRCARGVE